MSDRSGKIIGEDAERPASGTVNIVGNVVMLIEVQISEAPYLRVLLANDFDYLTCVSLGNLQSFTGSHDYSIPEGVDPNEYNTVLIWCDQFTVPIGKVKFQ
jgi:hypothetical protein